MKRTRLFHVGFIVVAVLGMLLAQCGGDDPCDPDPCPAVDGVGGSCVEFGTNDFICTCEPGVEWDGAANRCGECIPNCDGRECGDDGCGGSCGACDPEESCVDGQCVACTPECTGLECGDDGCGGSCGTCGQDEDCIDGQCIGCTPDCTGLECGDDGCGGSCGTCGQGETCEDGLCVEECTPDCTGLECGDDGCGGSCGTCPQGETCEDGLCVAGGAPAFAGGIYNMRATGIAQAPPNCLMNPFWTGSINAFIRTVDPIPIFLPSGADILLGQDLGSPFLLLIDLPAFGSVDVLLTLNETYDTILMDGPDDYTVDTQGLLPFAGADCVINGSADGEFTDIDTEPLTGSLTINIDSVAASPGGACNILKRPAAGVCNMTVNLNAGFPQ